MPTTYQFTPSLHYTHAELAEMFTLSFTGYFFPMNPTAEDYASFCRRHQVDFTRSLIMQDAAGTFAGMTRMGARGQRGWCGGFGVAPAFRGQGAAKVLAQRMVQEARDAGWTTLQLEVLAQNDPAIKVYQSAGFETTGTLVGLELMPAATLAPFAATHVTQLPVEAFPWDLYKLQALAWQREIPSVMTAATHAAQIHGTDGQSVAVLYEISDQRIIIHGIAGEQIEIELLQQLLGAIAGDAESLFVHTEAETSELIPRYRSLGFQEIYREYEMQMTL